MQLAGAPEISGGEHACCVFASDDAQAELVVKFTRDAVARHDRVFYVADRADETKVADYMTDAGLDGPAMLDSGALKVMHSSQMRLEDGFDRNRQIAAWRRLINAARTDGYRGLSVAAEMSWALTWKLDLDALIAYEAASAPVFVGGRFAAVCQYDSRLFEADTVQRAGHVHPVSIALNGDGLSVDYNRLLLHLGEDLEIAGEVDMSNVQFLERELTALLAKGDAVADCGGLTFIDAAGCRLLRDACNRDYGDGHLILRNTPAAVERVMAVFDSLERSG